MLNLAVLTNKSHALGVRSRARGVVAAVPDDDNSGILLVTLAGLNSLLAVEGLGGGGGPPR